MSPLPHRVVITGIGAISPYGTGLPAFWNGLRTASNPLSFSSTLKAVVGAVPSSSDPCATYKPAQLREMSRGSIFAVTAASEALKDAGIDEMGEGFHDETAVNIGMGIADLEAIHDAGQKIANGQTRRISPYFVPKILTNIPGSYVALKYNLRGGNSSTTTACATGASSIGEAFNAVRFGLARRAVAGAVESCLNPTAVEGFRRMRALASSEDATASRPFDEQRNGFVLSEGAGIVVLERLEDVISRPGTTIYAEVLGLGYGNDAYHLTAPSESGLGSTLCMRRCIINAGIEAGNVGYVNAHATSTPIGDKAEAASISTVKPGVAVSSIKGHTGHSLAAAGALETIATVMSLQEGVIIGTANLEKTDIEADVDLVKDSSVPWKSADRRIALMNSFGFGGAFVSLCLGEYRP
uniref:beta-ketoacyl-[acyl-carrier-protein] synthase I n=1 Tax=Panagrellus redivivus TaxID=6233 RepID=A0A7E5A2B9_PANRE